MQVIGLCRFSYPAIGGFQVEQDTIEERIAYLYAEDRLAERFALFETVALPALRAQTDPDFTLIIVIGDQFPDRHAQRLAALVQDLPQALIHREPPRNQRAVMKEVLNDARLSPSAPCLQFRQDDDDAVAVDFVQKLRSAATNSSALMQGHSSIALDWNNGYVAEFGADGIAASQTFRAFNVAALGMLIKGGSRLTLMNFAHQKIPQFMPAISFPDEAMFIRSHNTFNDSRQSGARAIPVKSLTRDQETLFRDRFAIDVNHVRRVFSAR